MISTLEVAMAQLIVRNLDDDVKEGLQARARRHGRSTEEEVRSILRQAVLADTEDDVPLGTRLVGRFRGAGLTAELLDLSDSGR
jgi:antitoxin FitA